MPAQTSQKQVQKDPHKTDGVIQQDSALQELIASATAGDKEAFGRLASLVQSDIHRLARKMLRDKDDASDVTQEVLMKLISRLKEYDRRRRFSTWLYRITVNATIDFMRRRARHTHDTLDIAARIPGGEATPEEKHDARGLGEILASASEVLTDRQQTALALRAVENWPVRDVASLMKVPEPTARWHIHRAKAAMRRNLTRHHPGLIRDYGLLRERHKRHK